MLNSVRISRRITNKQLHAAKRKAYSLYMVAHHLLQVPPDERGKIVTEVFSVAGVACFLEQPATTTEK